MNKVIVKKSISPTYGGISLDVVAQRGDRFDLALDGEVVIRDIRAEFLRK